MKKITTALALVFLLIQCGNPIKNEDTSINEEEGTVVTDTITEAIESSTDTTELVSAPETLDLLGYWVGDFMPGGPDGEWDKTMYIDEGFMWNRQNKINISIDYMADEKITGHSVVAGNDRPFTGSYYEKDGIYYFEVKEPGDDKYDGKFEFRIENNALIGTWKAFKKIEIQERKYDLAKREFKYNPDVMLERRGPFVNWEKFKSEIVKFDEEYSEEYREFETATDAIYEINASNKILTKADVENLKKGDLIIIRNTIYVRHGYSFKKRPLRVFFDAQPWYIPVYNNIKTELTDIEKENIKLLLRYEKNAKEYYDSFGRG